MDRISVEKALIEAAAAAMERARAYILRWPRGRSIPPRLGLWALGRAKESASSRKEVSMNATAIQTPGSEGDFSALL